MKQLVCQNKDCNSTNLDDLFVPDNSAFEKSVSGKNFTNTIGLEAVVAIEPLTRLNDGPLDATTDCLDCGTRHKVTQYAPGTF